jgi:hypothetical protein
MYNCQAFVAQKITYILMCDSLANIQLSNEKQLIHSYEEMSKVIRNFELNRVSLNQISK